MYMNFDEEHSPNVLENQTRLQNIAYTTRKEVGFPRTLRFIWTNFIRYKSRYSKKNPTWYGAKNSNEFVHFIIWSRGSPTLIYKPDLHVQSLYVTLLPGYVKNLIDWL